MSAFIYFALLIAGTALFAARKFRLNIWWVAFYAGAIYGLPVTVGYDIFGTQIPSIVSNTVLMLQSLLLLLCYLRGRRGPVCGDAPTQDGILSLVATVTCVVCFGALLATYGISVFFVHKTASGVDGYFYILWRMSATYAVLISVMERRYLHTMIALIPLAATLFAGDRTAVGLTAIALLWMGLQTGRMGGKRLGVAIPVVGAIAIFLFFGKTFQALWAIGGFSSASDLGSVLWSNGMESIINTEPFVVMGVFSALTHLNATPPGNLFLEVMSQLLIVPSWFGAESGSFNDFFQPILFPGFRPHSLAYSFWGEGYVRGGWIGVAFFGTIYCVVLGLFDRMSRRAPLAIRSFAFVGGAYWAFYIHRNSLVSIIAYERQIVVFIVFLVFASWVLRNFNRRIAP